MPIGYNVTQILAIDLDAGINGVVRYRFIGSEINTDFQSFQIDEIDGYINTAAEIDRETQDIFYVRD